MKKIKFRAKERHYVNKWKYGHYIQSTLGHFIYNIGSNIGTEINIKTLGQYTGLKDKNGVEIYDGDIVQDYENTKYIVEYRESTLSYDIKRCDNNKFDCPLSYMNTNGGYEVIGNIHEL